jgi:N-methylhydantoinase B
VRINELLQFEETRFRLGAIADEAAVRFSRSCFTPVIRDYLDFSTALCDPVGRVLVQGFALPLHLGAIPSAMRATLAAFPSGLDDGDVVVLNDPYAGGMHLPDIFVLAPAHVDGAIVGYSVIVAHHGDIGGRVPGGSAADSKEIFQEGLRLPPVRIYQGGRLDTTLRDVILANVRMPELLWSDLDAQVAIARLAASQFGDLQRELGIEFPEQTETIFSNTVTRLRAELDGWPSGTYRFEDYEDHDGLDDCLVPIRVEVVVKGGEISFDFTGSAPQVAGAINATRSFTESACYAAVRSLCADQIPVNQAFTDAITVITPPASVVDVSFPGAVAARGVIGYRIIDCIFGALADALPDRVPAAGDGGVSGIRIGGHDSHGNRYQFNDLLCGAWGARPDRDGIDGAAPMAANVANRSIEIIEASDPVRILGYRFVPDSEGAGRWRGGLAIQREIELLAPSGTLQIRTHRRGSVPYGLAGGDDGTSSDAWILREGSRTRLPAKATVEMRMGDVIGHRIASGGGVGPPLDRPRRRGRPRPRGWQGDDGTCDTGVWMAKMTLTEALAAFVTDTRSSDIPKTVRGNAVLAMADTVGTTVAGCNQPGPRVARQALSSWAGPGRSTVIGDDRRRDPASAALLNGMAAHALDFDVISFAVSGFVGSAIACALAGLVDDSPEDIAGREVVTAYVLGWEAAAALARAINPDHYARGWHPTATMSVIASALAAARLLGLDRTQTRYALSVAVADASGVKTMVGNMLNPYHVGKAARNGVVAARLAASGFVGHTDAIDAERGFLRVLQGEGRFDTSRTSESIGRVWDLLDPGPVFKIHPCCGLIHTAMDEIASLRKEGVDFSQVSRVEVLLHEYVLDVMDIGLPTTAYESKFSIAYCTAAAMLGRTGLVAFDRLDDEILAAMERVEFGVHPELLGGDTFFGEEFTELMLTTADGPVRRRRRRLENVGTGPTPPTDALRQKFVDCVTFGRPGIEASTVSDIWDELVAIDGERPFRSFSVFLG